MFISQRAQSQIELKKRGRVSCIIPPKHHQTTLKPTFLAKSVTAIATKETHPQWLQAALRSLTLLRATATTSIFKSVFVCVSNKQVCFLCVFSGQEKNGFGETCSFPTPPPPSCHMLSCSRTVAMNRALTVNLKAVALDLLSWLLRCPSVPTPA